MAEQAGAYIVPTMQMTQEDLHGLQAGTLPCQAVWKFRRDSEGILASQRLLAGSHVKVAYGTDCGMFPFSHGILEFQAMVKAGLNSVRALKAGTSVAAELLGQMTSACWRQVSSPTSSPCQAIPLPTSVSLRRWIS